MQRIRSIAAACLLSFSAFSCAVSESDVHRWETTEHGPEKLYAIVTHDKYAPPLRSEAALSLVRMHPRQGQRVGLDTLVKALESLMQTSPEAAKRIVSDMTPTMVEQMGEPPPARNAAGLTPADPSIPFKDAAFAMLSHEPPLVGDDKSKADMVAALTQWVGTDFEDRIDNTSQAYGVEQIMRYLGAPSARSLPGVINIDSTKVDRASKIIADIGDDDTKKKGSDALVALAKQIDAQSWRDKQRPLVEEANKKAGLTVTKDQVDEQIKKFQEQELQKVFGSMKVLGGRSTVDYCLAYAHDGSKSEAMRTAALAAVENRVDKNVKADIDDLFDIIKDDKNPDKVRALALARFGELPKDVVKSRLYTLFDGKKWQVRLDAAKLVLKTMTTKDVPDFLQHLPQSDKQKMALTEPIAYGAIILGLDQAGGPKARDTLTPYLQSKDIGPRLTAIGSYYGAKKAEASVLNSMEGDSTPVPKCDPADNCGWTCDVPKPGTQDKETKPIATVGDFVKYCIEPALQ